MDRRRPPDDRFQCVDVTIQYFDGPGLPEPRLDTRPRLGVPERAPDSCRLEDYIDANTNQFFGADTSSSNGSVEGDSRDNG